MIRLSRESEQRLNKRATQGETRLAGTRSDLPETRLGNPAKTGTRKPPRDGESVETKSPEESGLTFLAGVVDMKKKATGSQAAKKRPGKGGARKNSGPKPKHEGGTVKITARLPHDVAEWIAASGLTTAEALTQAVRTSPAFLIWRGESPAN